MRVTKLIFIVPLVAFLMSCTDESLPTATVETDAGVETAATVDGVLGKVDKTTDRFSFDQFGTEWVECLNDSLIWHGTIDIIWTTQTTPSGNVVSSWKLDYFDTAEPTWLEEQTSGNIWNIYKAENQGTGEVTKPMGTQFLQHYQWNEWYMNADGDRLKSGGSGGMKINRDGVVTRDFWENAVWCK